VAGERLRADELLVRQGLAESRAKAKALILAGDVRIGDRVIQKPAEVLQPDTPLELRAKLPFVSRGGLKLDHALQTFGIDVSGDVAADIGASTGGFTDVLLQRGARRVYAIDVGYGQLDYRLRTDPRVVVMERVNARYLDALPESVGVVCIDVSFISLEHILPVAARLLRDGGDVVALVKPQFEAGREAVGRGGVVRDERTRRATVERVIDFADQSGLVLRGVVRSPIAGPAGNEEFLVWFDRGDVAIDAEVALRAVFAREGSG
jgi:23S rRNA (cytidine1920-2'-O)/16S rRNA (cytidine1409-2'-O)-methyltransferase